MRYYYQVAMLIELDEEQEQELEMYISECPGELDEYNFVKNRGYQNWIDFEGKNIVFRKEEL